MKENNNKMITPPIEYTAQLPIDQEKKATDKVCRVCLAMNVKMYHISEHKLRVMYERVLGVKVNIEDKLPQKLCWECVARLSSANCFIVKALKTQRILTNKMYGDKFITIDDIESIDRAHNKLKSTLSTKFYKVNHSTIQILEDSSKTIIINNEYDNKSDSLNDNDRDTEFTESEEEMDEDFDYYGEEEINDKKNDTIDEGDENKSKEIDVNEEVVNDSYVEIEIENINNKKELNTMEKQCNEEEQRDNEEQISKEEYMSSVGLRLVSKKNNDMSQNEIDKSSEVVQQRWSRRINSSIPLRNLRTKKRPHCKELNVVLEDIGLSKDNTQDSIKQPNDTAEPAKDKENLVKNNEEIVSNQPESTKTYVSNCGITKTENKEESIVVIERDSMLYDTISLKRPYVCEICQKTFNHKSTLKRHTLLKHPKSFNCTYCSYKTDKKWNLSQHVNVKHTKANSFACPYCSYTTCNKYHLSIHVNAKHTKLNTFNCSHCSYQSYDQSGLYKHINAKHTKSAIFKCPHCSFKSFEKSALNKHVSYKHTKKTLYNCSYCEYESYIKGNLTIHVNAQHTKRTEFNCPYCSFKAYYNSYLNKHIRVKHP